MKPVIEFAEVADRLRMIEAWIESLMHKKSMPGMSVGVLYDRELLWARGFGLADVESQIPATPQTIYRIASITKTFTATAIMQLRDRGLLQLDDPVCRHLPWFRFHNRFPEAPEVTLRHLITHTSGLPRESPFPYWNDFKFPTREKMIESLTGQENAFPSETRWKYSNLALSIAGEVVAAVSGQPYHEYIYEHILEPLWMESTSVFLPDGHRSRLAVGYGQRRADGSRHIMPFSDLKGLAPAGNISSTVEDLARFISFQFSDGQAEGAQVLKESTLREMHRVQWLAPDWKSGSGLGFRIRRDEGRILCGHGGSVSGYRSQILFAPEEKVGVVCLVNADDADAGTYADRIMRWMAPTIVKAVSPPLEIKKANPAWERYVGKYRNQWSDAQIMLAGGELVMFDPSDEDLFAGMARLEPVEGHVFHMVGEEGLMSIGEKVVFEMGEDGKPLRVRLGATYIYPVSSWLDEVKEI